MSSSTGTPHHRREPLLTGWIWGGDSASDNGGGRQGGRMRGMSARWGPRYVFSSFLSCFITNDRFSYFIGCKPHLTTPTGVSNCSRGGGFRYETDKTHAHEQLLVGWFFFCVWAWYNNDNAAASNWTYPQPS